MQTAQNDAQRKELRRDGFTLAEERYSQSDHSFAYLQNYSLYAGLVEYKPTQLEVEQILLDAGLDQEDIKRGATTPSANATSSRNRR